MKKILLYSAIVGLFLASCSNEDSSMGFSDTRTEQVPVSIKLSSDTEFSTLRSVSPDSAGIKSLTYIVYKGSDGSYVKYKSLNSGDLSVINDTLPEGQYKVAIFATTRRDVNNYPSFDIEDFPGANQSFDKAKYSLSSGYGTSEDYFYKDLTLNLVSGGNAQSVVLERQTAKVEILPQDDMPANVSSVTFFFDLLGGQLFSFADNITTNIYRYTPDVIPSNFVLGKTMTREVFASDKGVSMLLFPFSSPDAKSGSGVAIKAIYFVDNKMYTKVIKTEYSLERNKILRLKGNLFAASQATNNSSISVDDTWDVEVVEGSFDN